MQTVTMEITIPKTLLSLGLRQEQIQSQVEKWLVISLFRDDAISSGKAASLLGISRRDFLDLLDQEGIAYLNYSDEELDAEFRAVRELKVDEAQA